MFRIRTLTEVFSKLNLASSCRGITAKANATELLLQKTSSLPIGSSSGANSFTTCPFRFPSGSSTAPSLSTTPAAPRVFQGDGLMTSSVSLSVRVNLSPLIRGFSTSLARGASLNQMHRTGPIRKIRRKRNPIGDGIPYAKALVLKTVIKKPKKPNSANRKCVLVRLSNGKEVIAHVPGQGHNLQEHNVVLVRVGRLRDVPGVNLKCVRGVHDLPHVMKRKNVE